MTTEQYYRKLLQLAAKAAGISKQWDGSLVDIDNPDRVWNPIENDGDALRLAVKLGIEVHPDREVGEVYTSFSVRAPHLLGLNIAEDFGVDEIAATRLVIVKSAAEIGRAMP